MNAHAFFPKVAPGTRHRFTVEDVWRMVEAGVIEPDASLEILDGDLITMPSEGEVHITVKALLIRHLNRSLEDEWLVVPDATLHLADDDAPEPDVYILRAGRALKPVDPKDVVLIVEIADSSLPYDLSRKAGKYAQYGVSEYWVVDVNARQSHVFTGPANGAYSNIVSASFDVALSPQVLPTLSVRFDHLAPPPAT